MNKIINGLTNPNVRHLLKGIHLCEKLNKHLKEKQQSDLIRRKQWETDHIFVDSNFEYLCVSSSDDEKNSLIKKD